MFRCTVQLHHQTQILLTHISVLMVNINYNMYLKIFGIIVIALAGIASCTKTYDRTYYLKVDSIRNLTEESKVYCKNLPIGRVTDLQLLSNLQVVIEIQIEGSFLPVKKDTFAIVD